MEQADIDRSTRTTISGIDGFAACKTKLNVAIGAQPLHITTQMLEITRELGLWDTVSFQTEKIVLLQLTKSGKKSLLFRSSLYPQD